MISAGLTRLHVSSNTLDTFKFELVTPRRGLEAVLKTIDRALSLGVENVKINVVVMKGFDDGQDAIEFVNFTKARPIAVRVWGALCP